MLVRRRGKWFALGTGTYITIINSTSLKHIFVRPSQDVVERRLSENVKVKLLLKKKKKLL